MQFLIRALVRALAQLFLYLRSRSQAYITAKYIYLSAVIHYLCVHKHCYLVRITSQVCFDLSDLCSTYYKYKHKGGEADKVDLVCKINMFFQIMILFISIVISFSFDLEFDFKQLEKQTTNVTQHIASIQNDLYFCKKQDHTRNLLALLCTFTSVKVAQVIILLSCISFNVGQKYTKIYSRKRCNSVFCNAQSKCTES